MQEASGCGRLVGVDGDALPTGGEVERRHRVEVVDQAQLTWVGVITR